MPIDATSAPPTPAQLIDAASQQINGVVGGVVAQLMAVNTAVQHVGKSVEDASDAFARVVTQGFGDINSALGAAIAEIQRRQSDAINTLHGLLLKVPDLDLPSLITINGKAIDPNPDQVYKLVRELLTKPDAIEIVLRGPLAVPLQPLVVGAADLHQRLRAVVLPPFGLPPNSAVLNSDPVTIAALIIIALILLGLPLSVAVGVAIGSLFLAMSAALIIAVAQGRSIEIDTCPTTDVGGGVPGVPQAIGVVTGLCTRLRIPAAA